MIDPASPPVNLGLERCKSGVFQDYFVFPQVGQEESEHGPLGSGLDL
jgi:hypothetical protein